MLILAKTESDSHKIMEMARTFNPKAQISMRTSDTGKPGYRKVHIIRINGLYERQENQIRARIFD